MFAYGKSRMAYEKNSVIKQPVPENKKTKFCDFTTLSCFLFSLPSRSNFPDFVYKWEMSNFFC